NLDDAPYHIHLSGNTAEETPYAIYLTQHGWQYVPLFLIVCHFCLPLAILRNRRTNRAPVAVARVAVAIMVMRFVDLYWTVMPHYQQGRGLTDAGFAVHWLDFATPIAIGGLWVAVFTWQLGRRPLIPRHDPRMAHLAEAHHG